MARLTRDDLFKIAENHGYEKNVPLHPTIRKNIAVDLAEALRKSDFPPTKVFNEDGTFRLMTVDEAVENLLEELV